jgi:hypothetical protein
VEEREHKDQQDSKDSDEAEEAGFTVTFTPQHVTDLSRSKRAWEFKAAPGNDFLVKK